MTFVFSNWKKSLLNRVGHSVATAACVTAGVLGVAVPGHAVGVAITYIDGANEGFNDPTLGPARRNAFEAAAAEWGSNFVGTVPISINAAMNPLFINAEKTSASLGNAGPTLVVSDWTGTPRPNVQYPSALANTLAGEDLFAGFSDITATFNSDLDDPAKWGRPWYYGTDGNNGTKFDFFTVVLHELGHGMGLLTRYNQNGTQQGGTFPFIYDLFLANGAGSDAMMASSMTDAGRQALLVSNAMFFNGPFATPANGGTNPKLFAPPGWTSGSTGHHLDYFTYYNTPDRLMVPSFTSTIHEPGPATVGILQDLGWALDSGPTSVELIDFRALAMSGGVWLRWRTGLEQDNMGFNVYRQRKRDDGTWGTKLKLNPALIASATLQSSPRVAETGGYLYGWPDKDVTNTSRVRYWLEDVETSGKITPHGPVKPIPTKVSITGRTRSPMVTELAP